MDRKRGDDLLMIVINFKLFEDSLSFKQIYGIIEPEQFRFFFSVGCCCG